MIKKILFSNIGYAKGIDGTLWQHFCRMHRHFYCPIPMQQQVLGQLKNIIREEQPDLCCFVEIDEGSFQAAGFNQMHALMDDDYHFHDMADKYGIDNILSRVPFHKGKNNGFMAKAIVPFERLYFDFGSKRLLYRLELPDGIQLFFGHFSLNRRVRLRQFQVLNHLVRQAPGKVIVMADFNIMDGFGELTAVTQETDLVILNKEEDITFTFHKRQLALDICLCSATLIDRIEIKIIPQPFSDHAALLVEII